MPASKAPANAAMTIARMTCSAAGSPLSDDPIHTAATAPAMYWPCPPMLNRPHRKANATASPVRMSAVVAIAVCCRFADATSTSCPVSQR